MLKSQYLFKIYIVHTKWYVQTSVVSSVILTKKCEILSIIIFAALIIGKIMTSHSSTTDETGVPLA